MWFLMEFPKFFPEVMKIYDIPLFQSVITSFISTFLFIWFVLFYNFLSKSNYLNSFVLLTEMFMEKVLNFFNDLFWNMPTKAKVYILFLFIYILWNNIIWVMGDMFSYVWPSFHHMFSPVTSDLFFNAILAMVWVLWAILYGFQMNWWSFMEKYIPYKWIWLADGVSNWYWFIVKFIDVILALFIGFLEFVWEFVKMMSLSVSLFWNMLAGMMLLWLMILMSMYMWNVLMGKPIPMLLPLMVFVFELFVGFLQALVFSLLVLVYFKVAETSHH